MTRPSVRRRRDALLAAAGDALVDARRRRVRNARLASIAVLVAISLVVARFLVPSGPSTIEQPAGRSTLVVDFRSIGTPSSSQARTVDFAIVDRPTAVARIATLTDDEAEQALAEAGCCVKIFRVRNQPVLVDCSTGAPADFGVSRSFIR